MLLLLISFVAGVLTVLAPCILPLLPVIVGGSMGEGQVNKKKALTIVVSLGVSVILFTLLLKVSTLFIDIPEYVWKDISGGVIILIGIITVIPNLWGGQLLSKFSTKANILLGKGAQKGNFFGDVIIGTALGPVFSTCSPTYFIVLATVLPVNLGLGLVYLLSYVIGLCLSLFFVAFIGQKIMNKLDVAADPNKFFKKFLGIVFIIVGIAVIQGYDKKLQTSILEKGFFDVTKIEQKLLEFNGKQKNSSVSFLQGMEDTKKAPEISTPDGFVNTNGKPVTLKEYQGKKIVLLDIWTYSCINCQRTIPHLNLLYTKYKDQGLQIIGLHTPEFAFEKVQKNVEDAVKRFGIEYPVVLDNDYSTWNALGNQFWPRKYLIDLNGNIIYDHIGEGGYEETENKIREALGLSDMTVSGNPEPVVATMTQSPETYIGSARRDNFFGKFSLASMNEQLARIPKDTFALFGEFADSAESVLENAPASLVYHFDAGKVFLVAGAPSKVSAKVYLDGKLISKDISGSDVVDATLTIQEHRLYNIVDLKGHPGVHMVRIEFQDSGASLFAFTFGA